MKVVDDIEGKKYLSISEVAEKHGISVEVLRKWEKDFPKVLKPMRTKGETRLYDKKQQENVAMIHHLLRVEGLSIEGARKKLSRSQSDEEVRQQVIGKLSNIRKQLMSIVDEIDNLQQVVNKQEGKGVVWVNK